MLIYYKDNSRSEIKELEFRISRIIAKSELVIMSTFYPFLFSIILFIEFTPSPPLSSLSHPASEIHAQENGNEDDDGLH